MKLAEIMQSKKGGENKEKICGDGRPCLRHKNVNLYKDKGQYPDCPNFPTKEIYGSIPPLPPGKIIVTVFIRPVHIIII